MKRNYMAEQVEFFPNLDHWEQVFWAVVNEIVDNQDETWNQLKKADSDKDWSEFWTDYYTTELL
jgi:hypothetical protein